MVLGCIGPVIATLGSILDSQPSWESCKMEPQSGIILIISHQISSGTTKISSGTTHPTTLLTANVWNFVQCPHTSINISFNVVWLFPHQQSMCSVPPPLSTCFFCAISPPPVGSDVTLHNYDPNNHIFQCALHDVEDCKISMLLT